MTPRALLLCSILALPSCGLIKDTAKEAAEVASEVLKREAPAIVAKAAEAAKTYWSANKDDILAGTKKVADAAKEFAASWWAENKASIIATAKDTANAIKDEAIAKALTEAKNYTDAKLKDLREKSLQNLYAKGYTKAEMDIDGNGEVSDDELAIFLKKNPTALYYAGGTGILFYLAWLAKQAAAKKTEPVSAPTA